MTSEAVCSQRVHNSVGVACAPTSRPIQLGGCHNLTKNPACSQLAGNSISVAHKSRRDSACHSHSIVVADLQTTAEVGVTATSVSSPLVL